MSLSVLSGLQAEQRRLVYVTFFTVVVAVVLYLVQPPCGYVVMELPVLPSDPQCSPSGWDSVDVERAFFGLGLDFLFLFLYPWWLSLLCEVVEQRLDHRDLMRRTIATCGSTVWVAGALDMVENIGLYFWLSGEREATLAWMISAAAASKFMILVTVVLCLLAMAGPALRGARSA